MRLAVLAGEPPSQAGLAWPRRGAAVAAVLAAMTLVVLDASVANLALPSIARALGVGSARAILVVTAYQAGLVMLLLPCGALGERFGYRRVFAGGVAVFTGASLLCALAPSLPVLAAARFVQGLGGAAVMALGVSLLRFTVPRGRLGAAIGWNALTVALASAAGPAIGAAILTRASWPWLFAVNLPLGLLALTAARALPSNAGRRQPVDAVSMVLSALCFGGLILAAELASSARAAAAGLVLLAVPGFALLVRRETAKTAPLVPFDLLSLKPFRISVIASVFCFTGQTAGLIALPFHLQHGFGLSPLQSGVYLTAWPLAVAAAAPLAGRLADRVSTARLCVLGGAVLALGLAATALWSPARGPAPLLGFVALCGLGFGLFQTPNNRNMFLSAPAERSGAAGGLQGAARLTGQTLGALAVAQLFTAAPMETAPRIAFGAGAVLTLAAGLASALRMDAARSAPRGSA